MPGPYTIARYPASLNKEASVQKFTGGDNVKPNSSANDSASLTSPDAGNAGATNTFRTLGAKAGIPVLLMDILKGSVAVNMVYFITDYQLMSDERFFELKLVFGIAAVIGHLFPVYIGFRGGKGIATMLGFMVGIYWQAAVVSAIVFVLIFKYLNFIPSFKICLTTFSQ